MRYTEKVEKIKKEIAAQLLKKKEAIENNKLNEAMFLNGVVAGLVISLDCLGEANIKYDKGE